MPTLKFSSRPISQSYPSSKPTPKKTPDSAPAGMRLLGDPAAAPADEEAVERASLRIVAIEPREVAVVGIVDRQQRRRRPPRRGLAVHALVLDVEPLVHEEERVGRHELAVAGRREVGLLRRGGRGGEHDTRDDGGGRDESGEKAMNHDAFLAAGVGDSAVSNANATRAGAQFRGISSSVRF